MDFQPWNSNRVEIPTEYEYVWHEGVYDYEGLACEHTYDSGTPTNYDYHTIQCTKCQGTVIEKCNLVYSVLSGGVNHRARCTECRNVYSEAHAWGGDGSTCELCGYSRLSNLKTDPELEIE